MSSPCHGCEMGLHRVCQFKLVSVPLLSTLRASNELAIARCGSGPRGVKRDENRTHANFLAGSRPPVDFVEKKYAAVQTVKVSKEVGRVRVLPYCTVLLVQ